MATGADEAAGRLRDSASRTCRQPTYHRPHVSPALSVARPHVIVTGLLGIDNRRMARGGVAGIKNTAWQE